MNPMLSFHLLEQRLLGVGAFQNLPEVTLEGSSNTFLQPKRLEIRSKSLLVHPAFRLHGVKVMNSRAVEVCAA